MKRLLSSAAMFLCCVTTSFAQFSGSGSGTESDPYLILNPIQLNQLRNFLNQEGVYFKLMADIDLTEFLEDENPSQGWMPVGTPSSPFKGVLDGNGKMVSGLWIKRSNIDYVGLFGYISGATVQDLNISDASFMGNDNVGSIAGYSVGSNINRCVIRCKINGYKYLGGLIGKASNTSAYDNIIEALIEGNDDYVGGLFGCLDGNNGVVQNCKIVGGKINGVNFVGGVCGSCCLKTTILGCNVYADISGLNSIGGVLGYVSYYGTTSYSTDSVYLYETSLNSCGFVGSIIGVSYVGGIVGQYFRRSIRPSREQEWVSSQTLYRCYAIGTIKATGDYVGGIIGDVRTKLSVNDCYYNGFVSGRNNVGGVAGYNYSQIQRSYSHASITATQNVGGIAGTNKGNISSSIANNVSIKVLEGNIGRVYGLSEGGSVGNGGDLTENKAYNRTIVINAGVAQEITDDEMNGTGVSRTTLKLKATYVAMGWDFTDIWAIQETECYPYFQWQTAPPVITSQVVSGATVVSGKCIDGGLITIEVDGVKQQMESTGNQFSFTVSPLQAGHEVHVSAKAEGKEQSYFATEIVSYLGKGTEADPYQIYTAADLTGVYRKGYFKLMNDIDLTDYINLFSPTEGWESIGREGSETIHFDGDGHKITGLWCNSTRDNTGLFSCFANGTIKNLTVETANGKQVKGGANTGILIGKMINGTIENCKVSGMVADGTPVGGMVGLFDGGQISLCQASVTINTTNGTSYVGGLVGEMTGGQIDQCVTLGTLKATGTESYVGGLVGKNSAKVTNCYSNAQVTSSYNAAGLIAYNYSLVEKCYATGDLYSNNYAAGVIGYNDGANAVVRNCAAMNKKIDVTFESQSAQSGGYGQRIIGGIKNGAPAPELNNYALKRMQVSVNDVPQRVYDDIMNGEAKAGADLMSAATYQELGWDFSSIWKIQETESYPYLINNEATVVGAGDESEPVTITAKSYSRVYGDANPTFEYTTSGAELTGIPEITCEATATSPVGTYPIVIKKGSVTNDNDSYVNGTLTITKAPLTIKAGMYTKKQGEENPVFTLSYEGFKNGETSAVLTTQPTATTTATQASPIGDYEVKVSGAAAQNYEITYVSGTLKVTDADAVIVTANSYSRIYGETNPNFEYTSSGAALTGNPEISCEATVTSPVGTYPIVIKKGSVTNFNDTYVNGTLTITKAPLTIKACTYTKQQGMDNPEFKLTYEGFKNNETAAVLTTQPSVYTSATKDSPLGDYEVIVSGATAQNYDITHVNGTLKVTEADAVTIIAKDYIRAYGDANPTFDFTSSGAALNGTPEITCEATATSPVGTYPIVIKKGSVTNYNDSYVNGTLTITKAPLIIKAGTYTKKQGEENPEFTLSYIGFKNNETASVLTTQPSVTTTAVKNSPVGEYDVIVFGAAAQNYDLNYINGKLVVTQADAVIIIAKDYTRMYGDANPTFDYSSIGAELNGRPEITCEATVSSPVGTYPIVIKKGTVTNFNDTYVNGTLTITKAPLTVSVADASIRQGQNIPTFVLSYNGFRNGDTESTAFTSKPTASTIATSNSLPGTYPIVVSGGVAQNYALTYQQGTLTIVLPDGIDAVSNDQSVTWYTIDGKKLDSAPNREGIYIVNGRKVIIK